ncbi:MAG TPA: GAF domain-containing protein [Bacteroidales bacterium]|nr:GAF domain-containing protein [Bacteroidales bacterium]
MIHFLKKIRLREPEIFTSPAEHLTSKETGEEIFSAGEFLKKLLANNDSPEEYAQKVLSALAGEMEILQAVFLVMKDVASEPKLAFLAGYACLEEEDHTDEFSIGEGLPGQVARDGESLRLHEVPKGYMTIRTGLGEASPASLIIMPVKYGKEILGVIEIASFRGFTDEEDHFLDDLSTELGGYLKHFHINGYINPGNEA